MNSRKLKQKNNVSFTVCPLCRNSAELCDSHIIPQFVFDWLKRTSSTGFLRLLSSINRRVQDGHTDQMLCASCENLFSGWEKEFAETVFKPFHDTETEVVDYSAWMLKFAVSIVWRVLVVSRQLGLNNYSTHQLSMVDSALETWREFLIADSTAPRLPNIRLLLLDPAVNTSLPNVPEDLNRYFMRAVETDVCKSLTGMFVYAKMCRITLIGFVNMPESHNVLGLPIQLGHGQIDRRSSQTITEDVFDYMMRRVQHMTKIESTISGKQRRNIDSSIDSNPESYLTSETHDALVKDIVLNANQRRRD